MLSRVQPRQPAVCCSRPAAQMSPRRRHGWPGRRRRPPLRLRAMSSPARSGARSLAKLLAAQAWPSPACGADGCDRGPLRGQPFLRRELLATWPVQGGQLPQALRDLLLQRSPASTIRRRTCCAWPRQPGAKSDTRCSAQPRGCLTVPCATRSARPWMAASWSPSRTRAASGSVMRCWRRRSTRPSSPGSARNCTRAWPRNSRAAERRGRQNSSRTGRRRAVRPRRSRRRSKPRARPRRSSVSRRLTRIWSGRSRSGPRTGRGWAHRAWPPRTLRLDGPACQPGRRRPAGGRTRPAGDRPRRRGRAAPCGAPPRVAR